MALFEEQLGFKLEEPDLANELKKMLLRRDNSEAEKFTQETVSDEAINRIFQIPDSDHLLVTSAKKCIFWSPNMKEEDKAQYADLNLQFNDGALFTSQTYNPQMKTLCIVAYARNTNTTKNFLLNFSEKKPLWKSYTLPTLTISKPLTCFFFLSPIEKKEYLCLCADDLSARLYEIENEKCEEKYCIFQAHDIVTPETSDDKHLSLKIQFCYKTKMLISSKNFSRIIVCDIEKSILSSNSLKKDSQIENFNVKKKMANIQKYAIESEFITGLEIRFLILGNEEKFIIFAGTNIFVKVELFSLTKYFLVGLNDNEKQYSDQFHIKIIDENIQKFGIEGEFNDIMGMSLSSDDNLVAISCSEDYMFNQIKILSLQINSVLTAITRFKDTISSTIFDRDGYRIISSILKSIRFDYFRNNLVIGELKNHFLLEDPLTHIKGIEFSKDQDLLAVYGDRNFEIGVYNVCYEKKFDGWNKVLLPRFDLAYSIIVDSNDEIRVIPASEYSKIKEFSKLRGPEDAILSAKFLNNPDQLIVLDFRGFVYLFDSKTGELLGKDQPKKYENNEINVKGRIFINNLFDNAFEESGEDINKKNEIFGEIEESDVLLNKKSDFKKQKKRRDSEESMSSVSDRRKSARPIFDRRAIRGYIITSVKIEDNQDRSIFSTIIRIYKIGEGIKDFCICKELKLPFVNLEIKDLYLLVHDEGTNLATIGLTISNFVAFLDIDESFRISKISENVWKEGSYGKSHYNLIRSKFKPICIVFSQNLILFSDEQFSIYIYSFKTRKFVKKLSGLHQQPITRMFISEDDNYVTTCSEDLSVKVIDLRLLQVAWELENVHRCKIFSNL